MPPCEGQWGCMGYVYTQKNTHEDLLGIVIRVWLAYEERGCLMAYKPDEHKTFFTIVFLLLIGAGVYGLSTGD